MFSGIGAPPSARAAAIKKGTGKWTPVCAQKVPHRYHLAVRSMPSFAFGVFTKTSSSLLRGSHHAVVLLPGALFWIHSSCRPDAAAPQSSAISEGNR
ncbi:hypothetical protein AcW1_003042 [Taiwanofungus camphoratus]|nr:hypothetical protein AcV7_005540 [Antrodia cinnamomea]KAI0942398.1 hypothetical protein AcW1_003042 [Antrodia cinnamomea]